jgi:hypothetical protein
VIAVKELFALSFAEMDVDFDIGAHILYRNCAKS